MIRHLIVASAYERNISRKYRKEVKIKKISKISHMDEIIQKKRQELLFTKRSLCFSPCCIFKGTILLNGLFLLPQIFSTIFQAKELEK